MNEEQKQKIRDSINSILGVFDDIMNAERQDVAITLNHIEEQAKKNGWSQDYINAVGDAKKQLKIKGTILELYRV